MKLFFLIIALLVTSLLVRGQTNRIIQVVDSVTREPVIGATIRTPSAIKPLVGVVTDAKGFASMTRLPPA